MRINVSHEVDFTYTRSSGPGGQNVNKVNSKAVLRWKPLESLTLKEQLPAWVRERILNQLSPQLTSQGELVLSSDRYRDQPRNREDCLQRLHHLIEKASIRPKSRIETKPTRSSQRRRKVEKSKQSEKKRLRTFRQDE